VVPAVDTPVDLNLWYVINPHGMHDSASAATTPEEAPGIG
jgi:hypothetical protein